MYSGVATGLTYCGISAHTIWIVSQLVASPTYIGSIGSNTQHKEKNHCTRAWSHTRRQFKVTNKTGFSDCRLSFCQYRGLANHRGYKRRRIGVLRTIDNKLPAKLKRHTNPIFGEGIKDTSIKVYSNTTEIENMQKKLGDSSVEVTLRYRSCLLAELLHFPSTSVLSRSALAEDENHGGIRATGVVGVAFFNSQKRSLGKKELPAVSPSHRR